MTPHIFSKENAASLAAGFALTIGNIAFNVIQPYLLSKTIDSINNEDEVSLFGYNVPNSMLYASGYALSWGLSNLTSSFRAIAVAKIGTNAGRFITTDYINHVVNQTSNHELKGKLSDHVSRVIKIYTSLPDSTNRLFAQVIPTTLEVGVASAILSYFYGFPIGIGLSSIAAAYTIYELATKGVVTKSRDIAVKQNYLLHEAIINLMENHEAIHIWGNMAREKKILQDALMQYNKDNFNVGLNVAKLNIGQGIITTSGLVGMALYIIENIRTGKYNLNNFVSILSYLIPYLSSLNSFGIALNQLVSDIKDIDAIFEELEVESEVENKSNKYFFLMKDTARITFNEISYAYDNKSKILDNLSFEIFPGQKVGIVGISGSGKSTIAKLLMRFIDPSKGEIVIYSQKINEVSLVSLRNKIGYIQQKPVIFNNTLYYNIVYPLLGDNSRVDEEILMQVIKDACLEEFINSLPNGLDTVIGERGLNLSNGQKILIDIARLFLKRPDIIILDDITSSLDNNIAKIIHDNIEKRFKDTTTIIISNNLHSLVNMDNIIVLNNGKIAEQGKHSELINNPKGIYSDLWSKHKHKNTVVPMSAVDPNANQQQLPPPKRKLKRLNLFGKTADNHASTSVESKMKKVHVSKTASKQ